MAFSTWSALMAHLDALGLFHMDMRLERMERALAALGLTSATLPAVIQVVGTNGKGSTSSFIDAIARSHGLRTGLYTSPHLRHITERIRIDGCPLPASRWPLLASEVHAVAPELTHFELLTALAVLAFVRAKVDCIILEAGLGGHYDATSAVPADVVAFTPIALDHQNVLGPDLTHIATDKAHAMRPGKTAVSAPQQPEAMHCLVAMAAERNSPLLFAPSAPCVLVPGASGKGLPPVLGLKGPHQQSNAALALNAWRALAVARGWTSKPEAELDGLAKAFIPGRLQHIPACHAHPPLLLDGAHNVHGLEHLEQALRADDIQPRAVIFTCLADKDEQGMLPLVARIASQAPVFVPGMPDNPRARDAAELSCALAAVAPPVASSAAVISPCPDLDAALALAFAVPGPASAPILICGSLYILGDVFARYPEYIEPAV